jgi:hypothetical protein
MAKETRHVRFMPDRSRKSLGKDASQLAKSIVDRATEEVAPEAVEEAKPKKKDPAAVALGRRGGLKGGKARAQALSPEQRAAIARRAALSRWKSDS